MIDYQVRLKSNGNYWKATWKDPATGKWPSESLGPKSELTRRQAEALCRRKAVDLTLGQARNGNAPRLSEWVEQYKRLRTDVDAKTLGLIDHAGRYLLEYFTHNPPIDRITRADAAEWRAALARGELAGANVYPKPADKVAPGTKYHKYRKALAAKGPKSMAESTVCKHVRTVKRMFAEATDEEGVGHIRQNPFRKLSGKAPKPVKSWAVVTLADTAKILDACPSVGWRCLFALCRLAGLRRQEALDLRWADVRWGDNRLMVNAHITRETTKRAPRACPINPAKAPTELAAVLQAAYDAAPEGAVLVCDGVPVDDLDRDSKKIINSAGIVAYAKPFHALRKNRAGELAAVYPQHVVTEWLGHDADVAQTFYLRVDDVYWAAPAETAQTAAQSPPGNSAP